MDYTWSVIQMGSGNLGRPKEGHLNLGVGVLNSAFLEEGMLPKLASFGVEIGCRW